jgi:hypothetical protein
MILILGDYYVIMCMIILVITINTCALKRLTNIVDTNVINNIMRYFNVLIYEIQICDMYLLIKV